MKKWLLLLLFIGASGLVKAESLQLNSEVSRLSFATVKMQYIVEPAVIAGLTGKIDETGVVTLDIPLAGIETGIGIRNERLNQLFFQSQLFPSAKVTAHVPKSLLTTDTAVQQLTISAQVTLFGKTKPMDFLVNVVKSHDVISVATAKTVIVRAADFGIPTKNLTELAKTVGQIAISDTVPVHFSLVFGK